MSDPNADAAEYANLLWRDITRAVISLVFPHHWRHEHLGDDAIELDLDELANVNTVGTKEDGDTVVWNEATEKWIPGAGGGGGKHGVAVGLAGTITTGTDLPPGPVNPFGAALTVKKLYLYGNDAVEIDFGSLGTFSLSAGGGTTSGTTLSETWANGAQLSWTLSSAGTVLTSLGWTIEAEE